MIVRRESSDDVVVAIVRWESLSLVIGVSITIGTSRRVVCTAAASPAGAVKALVDVATTLCAGVAKNDGSVGGVGVGAGAGVAGAGAHAGGPTKMLEAAYAPPNRQRVAGSTEATRSTNASLGSHRNVYSRSIAKCVTGTSSGTVQLADDCWPFPT